MSPVHLTPNGRILQLIGSPDGDPGHERNIKLWFVSSEEGSLYRLASALKKRGYNLVIQRVSGSSTWRCIAKKIYNPAEEPLDRLCLSMLDLAEEFEVAFISWETAIPDSPSSFGTG
ncbi:MAG: ribonuclease E inhibitor RraB [Balneolaceae bacterium]